MPWVLELNLSILDDLGETPQILEV